MLIALCLLVLAGLVGGALAGRLGAPPLLGMLLAGVLLGPSVLGLIDADVRAALAECKTIALVVILLRAGLGIRKGTLVTIGGPALRMGCLPCVFEAAAVTLVAHQLLGLRLYEAGMAGAIVAAVSPAVIVPQMLELKEAGYGKQREVPTLVLAGASLDDVFAITLFGVFAGLAAGVEQGFFGVAWRVVSGVLLGVALGVALGAALGRLFRRFVRREVVRTVVLAAVSVLFLQLSELEAVQRIVPIAALLGIMAAGFVLLDRGPLMVESLSRHFTAVWVLAEVLLFVYIGSRVQLERLDGSQLLAGLGVLAAGLCLRSVGVAASLARSPLTRAERWFCVLSYLPKATVQAAMGAVPLGLIAEGKLGSTSTAAGETILALAVLSIVITAPLGALLIRIYGPRLLERSAARERPSELGPAVGAASAGK